jgi:hypothetical protein
MFDFKGIFKFDTWCATFLVQYRFTKRTTFNLQGFQEDLFIASTMIRTMLKDTNLITHFWTLHGYQHKWYYAQHVTERFPNGQTISNDGSGSWNLLKQTILTYCNGKSEMGYTTERSTGTSMPVPSPSSLFVCKSSWYSVWFLMNSTTRTQPMR